MNRRWNHIGLVWVLGGAMLLASCSGLQRREPGKTPKTSRVQQLLAKLPTEDQDEGWKVCRRLLNTGPEGIREICEMLVPMGAGDDASARFALNGISSCVMQPKAREKQRELFARELIRALGEQPDREVQAYLLYQLRFVAKEESVETAAKYLGDEWLCEPAVAVLQTVATPAAVDALTRALASAEGKNRVAIVLALGELKAAGSLPVFAADASSADRTLRDAALFSAANSGSPASLNLFLNLSREEADSPLRRAELASLCLLYARRLAECGETPGAIQVSRSVIENRQGLGEDSALASALSLLTELKGEDALPDLLAVMDHPDGKARRVALDLANTIPGQKTTQAWLEKMKTAAPEVRAEIVAMLGRRGDQGSLPSLFEALNDEEEIVRMSAIEASAALGGSKALPQLLAFLKTDRAGEIQKTAEILGRLPGDETTAAIAGALPAVSPESRAALIEVLGLRRAKDFVETIFPYSGDDSRSVRVAAIKVLGDLADASALPRLIQVLLNAESSSEQAAARKAVVALCRQVPDAESQSDALLEALGNAKAAGQKAVLMKAIAQIGTQKGLEAIVAEIGAGDEAVRDGAIRALADWEDIRAATDMLQVARSADLPAHRILALQGLIRVIGGANVSPDTKLEMYKKASSAAERPEEKRLVLSGLAGIKTVESLETAGGFLDDADLRSEAALTAVTIALPQNENEEGLRGEIVESVLTKALGSIIDADTRRQVQEYLAILQRPDEANLALGKPVKASVRHQLDFTPEKAVDGDKRKYSHWDGVSWPCWFQVDLTEAVRIESVHILFYWDDSRYCQYTVEASTDEIHWTLVADRSQTREKSTFRGDLHVFEPIEARYVRINILRNSANSAAHIVELSVYGQGKTPARLFAPEFDEEGFTDLFNARDLTGWTGNTEGYVAEDGKIVVHPELGGGNLYTAKEYADFILRFEFKLTPGANNGLGIRAPLEGNAAYLGMELQILDNTDEQYKDLKPYQYHGSIYGVAPAKREFLKPLGEWNTEEVIARGQRITVKLNGHTIVDADIGPAIESGAMDGQEHPGLKRASGHIGFLGHGSRVEFRNLRIQELPPAEAENEEGFESLFDGSTLTGWKIHEGLPDGVGGKWTVENGAIAGVQDPPGQGGFFTTERSFRDFDLRLESKIDWPFDSGVFLRVGPDGKSHQVTLDYRSGGEIGGIYCPWTQGFVSHCAEGMDLWKKDEWNDLRIVCEGEPSRIRVWLNGKLITDFQHTEDTTRGVPETGTICLQVHPGGEGFDKGKALFRNIRIRELARD